MDRLHDWLLWEHVENQALVYAEKLTISLDDFSIENRTEIPFGFHVAKPVIQRRAANLANIRLTYTDAEGTATVTLDKPLEVCRPRPSPGVARHVRCAVPLISPPHHDNVPLIALR